MMIPAGEITEKTFQQLLKILEPGDTIIDGGNSNFRDSQRRYKEARKQKISFVDVGVSGGIWGLEVGFCLMAGGDKATGEAARADLPRARARGRLRARRAVRCRALREDGAQRDRVRPDAGLRRGLRGDEGAPSSTSTCTRSPGIWRYGSVVRSWLLELLHAAFEKEGGELEKIRGYVEDSGEGRWTIAEAIAEDVPVPVITRGALRALRLAAGRVVRRQGQRGAAQPVRRPRGQGGREGEDAAQDPRA